MLISRPCIRIELFLFLCFPSFLLGPWLIKVPSYHSGIAYTMTAIDTDVSEVQRMFDINVFGPMRMVRSFHAMIIHAQGTIVNISSIGGLIPFLYGCKYSRNFLSSLFSGLQTY